MDNLNKNNEDNGDNKKTLDIDDVLEFPQNFEEICKGEMEKSYEIYKGFFDKIKANQEESKIEDEKNVEKTDEEKCVRYVKLEEEDAYGEECEKECLNDVKCIEDKGISNGKEEENTGNFIGEEGSEVKGNENEVKDGGGISVINKCGKETKKERLEFKDMLFRLNSIEYKAPDWAEGLTDEEFIEKLRERSNNRIKLKEKK